MFFVKIILKRYASMMRQTKPMKLINGSCKEYIELNFILKLTKVKKTLTIMP